MSRTSCPARRAAAATSSSPSGSRRRNTFEYMSGPGWTAKIFIAALAPCGSRTMRMTTGRIAEPCANEPASLVARARRRGHSGLAERYRPRRQDELDRRALLPDAKRDRNAVIVEPDNAALAAFDEILMEQAGLAVERHRPQVAAGDMNVLDLAGLGRHHHVRIEHARRPGIGGAHAGRRQRRSVGRGDHETIAARLTGDREALAVCRGDAVEGDETAVPPIFASGRVLLVHGEAEQPQGDVEPALDMRAIAHLLDDIRIGTDISECRVLDGIFVNLSLRMRRPGGRA